MNSQEVTIKHEIAAVHVVDPSTRSVAEGFPVDLLLLAGPRGSKPSGTELRREAREWDDSKLIRLTGELYQWYRVLDAEGARRGHWTAIDAPEEWSAGMLPDALDLQELNGVQLEQWISDLGDALRLARDEADSREGDR